MKKFYLAMLVIAAIFTVTSCGNRGKKAEKAEAETIADVQDAADWEQRVYSHSYDGFTNVRKGPSSKASVLGKLRNGKEYVVVIGEVDNWLEVEYNGQVGYVHRDYVSERPSKPVYVEVDKWIEGLWYTHGGFQCYLFFSNGNYVLVGEWYEDIVAGKWHLEGKEIVLTPEYFDKSSRWWDDSFREVVRLEVNQKARTLGDIEKSPFGDPNSPDYRNEGAMDWSKADFRIEKKRISKLL